MIVLISTTTAITLTEAFTAGSVLALTIYSVLKNKKIPTIKSNRKEPNKND